MADSTLMHLVADNIREVLGNDDVINLQIEVPPYGDNPDPNTEYEITVQGLDSSDAPVVTKRVRCCPRPCKP